MLEAFENIEHLGEISRLFLVLSRRGRFRMEQTALIDGCKHTAGLCSRYPRPKPAMDLAIYAGLINCANGIITATDRGRQFAAQFSGSHLDLSQFQAKLLLGAFLDHADVKLAILSLIGDFQLIRGKLIVRKNFLQSNDTRLLFCRLLQQMGAIKISGEYYVIDHAFDDILENCIIGSAKLTQLELLVRHSRPGEAKPSEYELRYRLVIHAV